jgi:parallel beta-helix repeat protein
MGNYVENSVARGISLSSSNNTQIIYNNVYNNPFGIYVFQSSDNSFSDNDVMNSSSYGMYMYDSDNNIFNGDVFLDSSTYDIRLDDSLNNNFTNVNYTTESVDANSDLTRNWYLTIQANYSNGIAVGNESSILGTDVNSALKMNTTTYDGWSYGVFTEYFNDGGSKTYYNNYTINASIEGYDMIQRVVNMSENVHLNLTFYNGYAVRDSLGDAVAWMTNGGDVVLKGSCTSGGSCSAPASSFIVKDSGDATVAYIDSDGNMCIETGDCSDYSASCNPTEDAFVIQNSSSDNMSYIDTDGDLCLTGGLFENEL